jgi:hypothetical protein
MSLMRLGYRELGLELISLWEDFSLHPKWTPMVEKERYDGVVGHLKFSLKESFTQKRNDMMANFTHIL